MHAVEAPRDSAFGLAGVGESALAYPDETVHDAA